MLIYSSEDNKILERYEDRISIVALYIADGDIQEAFNYAKIMINQEYQPATPTFLNSGKLKAGELVSCFLLETDDSLNSIGYVQTSSMKLSALGGGVGINLSKLRGRGDAIKGISNRASGIMPVAKILEDTFSYANQLGMRDGAGAVYLNIFHSDVEEFLSSKKVNADEKVRLKTLSIGLIIPDKFYDMSVEAINNVPGMVGLTHIFNNVGVASDSKSSVELLVSMNLFPDFLRTTALLNLVLSASMLPQ